MIKRILAGATGVVTTANGVMMLLDGPRWYESVPGVSETGPFNPHFVNDVGAAFLVSGIALLARAWRPQYWPAALAGAGFLCAHALIHVAGIFSGDAHHAGFEWLMIVAPAAIALWASLPTKGERHA